MKFRIAIAVLIAGTILSCTNREKASVCVNLENADGARVYLVEQRVTGNHTADSGSINFLGRTVFRIDLKTPSFYYLELENGEVMSMIVTPGEKIRIKADYQDVHSTKTITGSENTIRLNVLYDSLRTTNQMLDALRAEYQVIVDSGNTDESEKTALEKSYMDIQKAYHRFSVEFILSDFTSLTNIAALYQE